MQFQCIYHLQDLSCLFAATHYSGNSLKGLSKLRTQYKKPPYLGQVLQSQWYHANTFLPLKEENLYITAKMTKKWLVSVHYKEVPL